MTRGWTSNDLTVVCEDDTLWTVADAARHLGPMPDDPEDTPLLVTVSKLRLATRLHPRHLPPAGKRRSSRPGQPGRYARVYRASSFIALYEHLDADSLSPAAAA